MVNHQAMSSEAMNLVGGTVAVIDFMLSLEGDRNAMKDRFPAAGDGLQMFLLEVECELFQWGFTGLQVHPIGASQGTDVSQVQLLVQEFGRSPAG